jgi:hypothetical protein
MKEEVKRPLVVKLFIILIIYQIIIIAVNMALGNFGAIGWLLLPAVYFGLWKMERNWMYFLLFGWSISQVGNAYLIISNLKNFNILFLIDFAVVILNVMAISWCIFNRNLFSKSEKKK